MKKISILFLSLCLMFSVSAQNEYDDEVPQTGEEEFVGFNKKNKKNKEEKDLSRIRIGGTAGFGAGTNQLGFNISPLVGYQVVEDRIELGGGFQYDLYREGIKNNYKYLQHTYGPIAYGRIYIWEGLFAQIKGVYLISNAKQTNYISSSNTVITKYKDDFFNVYGGAGYSFPIGDKAYFNLGLEINIIPFENNGLSNRKPRSVSPFFNFQFSL